MYIFYLYVQTVTRQCFCFPNSQWGVTTHDTGMWQESSKCKERKRKQQISQPKKFYLAEQLLKRKVLPNNYM